MAELFCCISTLVYLIGSLYLIKAIWTIVSAVRIAFTSINVEWATKYGLGSWAVVTGCTEGIGKAFCFPLAAVRFNLCLVSRNKQKLEALERELRSKYPTIQTMILVADFSEYSDKLYDRLAQALSGVDVSILVNNVGMAYLNHLHKQTTTEIETQINVNVNAITHLTHRLIGNMRKRTNRSAIVNLSSMSIIVPFQTLSVYAGTKAYDDVFSRALTEECTNSNIDVVSCRPCIVATPGTNNSTDFVACSAESCALGTLRALGKAKTTEGSFYHVVQTWLVHVIGETLVRLFGDRKLHDFEKEKST